jgi:hypothetical protein
MGVAVQRPENVTPCNDAIFIFEGEGLLGSAGVMKLADLNYCIIV